MTSGIRSLFRLSLVAVLSGALSVGTGWANVINLTHPYTNTTIAAVLATNLTVNGDVILVNTNIQTESGISITKAVTITGLGMTNTILQAQATRGAAAAWLFNATLTSNLVTIQNMTLRNASNNASAYAAVLRLSGVGATGIVNNCLITQNDDSYVYGGLLAHENVSTALTMSNCVVATNSGIAVNVYTPSGDLYIINSSFFDNQSPASQLITSARNGTSRFLAANSTFTRNACGTVANPGLLYIYENITANTNNFLYNCTICSNTSPGTIGGVNFYGNGNTAATMTLNSCIIYGNSGYDVNASYGNVYVTNSLISSNYSGLVKTNGSLVGVDPKLIPFAYNGGATPTYALQAGSPCIDTGANPLTLPYDQRGAGCPRVVGVAADMGAIEYGAGTTGIVYLSTTFSEWYANDGTINNDNPMLIELLNATFAGTNGENLVASGKLQVTNYPSGYTFVAQQVNSNLLSVTITGSTSPNGSANNVSNLGFAFQSSAFTLGNTNLIANATVNNLQINFLDSEQLPVLTWTGTNFLESAVNDGTISNAMTITLANDDFIGTNGQNLAVGGYVTTPSLPNNLTAMVTRVSGKQVVITLAGAKSLPHNAAQSVANLGSFTVTASALADGRNDMVNPTSPTDSITFLDPVLTWSGNAFIESGYNDGSISNTLAIGLAGDFLTGANGDDFVAATKVAVSNVPPGLTAVITRASPTNLTAALTGKAQPHDVANSISNLVFVFQSSAFSNTANNVVTNYARTNLLVSFLSNAVTYYVATNGSDATGAGTSLSPWATITNAQAHCRANCEDVIFLGSGTFTQPNNTITKGVAIKGAGAGVTILQAANARSNSPMPGLIFNLNSPGNVFTISDMTIQYGYTNNTTGGGAIYGAAGSGCTLARCVLQQNDAPSGSGGAIYSLIPLVVSNCTFSSNVCGGNGGAICVNAQGCLYYGCTLNDNFATNGTGGAIYSQGFHTLQNDTFIHNRSGPLKQGGAVYSYSGGGIATHCTFVSNTCYNNAGGGGIAYNGAYNSFVQNSLFYTNMGGASGTALSEIQVAGAGPAIAVTNCCFTAPFSIAQITTNLACVFSANPMIGPLADNGGYTWTCAITNPASPCVGKANLATALPYDQRGCKRDAAPDIGAFEYGAHVPYPPGTGIFFR